MHRPVCVSLRNSRGEEGDIPTCTMSLNSFLLCSYNIIIIRYKNNNLNERTCHRNIILTSTAGIT